MKKAGTKETKAKKTKAKKTAAKSSPPAKVEAQQDDFEAFEGGEFDTASRPDHVTEDDVNPETEGGGFPPTLKLMQNLSPELDEDEEKHIPDAEAGDLVVDDGTTQTLFDGKEGITFIPLLSRKRWNEWVPRKRGGGFVASYASKEEAEAYFSPGNELNVAIEYLCTTNEVDSEGNYTALLIQFNSPTKMAVARALATYIKEYKTMYGVAYQIKSKKQTNKAGQKFFNFEITPRGWLKEQLYSTVQALQLENTEPFVNQPSFLPDGAGDEDGDM